MNHLTPDRRRFPRVHADAPLLVSPGGGAPKEFFVADTVSLGGLMFRSDKSFGRGSLLQLDLALGDRVVEASGRVAYERITVVGDLEVGVEFLRLSPGSADLLRALLPQCA